jgi:hypothetical protein
MRQEKSMRGTRIAICGTIGELVRIAQPVRPGQTMVRTFFHDDRGNKLSETDARGTTFFD